MRLCLSALLIAFGVACATNKNGPQVVTTQVVTIPDGALVEFNGKPAGRSPAQIVLPQDAQGRLTERAELIVLPNSDQASVYPQRRIFEPEARTERVPDRILVDMTRGGTNETKLARGSAPKTETRTSSRPAPPVPYTNRGKPTQAVGLERWSPGIY